MVDGMCEVENPAKEHEGYEFLVGRMANGLNVHIRAEGGHRN